MSALLTTLIVLASIAAYCAVAGAVGLTFYRQRKKACARCNDRGAYSYGCSSDHDAVAAFAGLFWPAILPALVGMWFIDKDERAAKHAARLAAEIDRLEKDLNIGDKS